MGIDNVIHVEIIDNGPGMRPEELEQIFQPFYRGGAVGDLLHFVRQNMINCRMHSDSCKRFCFDAVSYIETAIFLPFTDARETNTEL